MRRHPLLYVVGQLEGGGLESQLFHLLKYMDRDRYQPSVAVWTFHEDDPYVARIRELEVDVHGLPTEGGRVRRLWALRALVQSSGAELLHSFGFFTNIAAAIAVYGTDCIAVGAIQGDYYYDRSESGRIIGWLSSHYPRFQIANNAQAVKNAGSADGPAVRRVVVRQGIDLDKFRAIPPTPTPLIKIGGVGSLIPIKRWDRFIRMAGWLREQDLPIRLHIAGEGQERANLEKQIQTARLEEFLILEGRVDNVPEFLESCDLVVHTSDSEGCPNIVMEAHACGRPVVATDVGDVQDLVEDGVTGFVVAPENETALCAAVQELIRNPEHRLRMGRAARETSERKFTPARYLREMFTAYEDAGWRASNI